MNNLNSMKQLVLVVLLILCRASFGQTVGTIQYDNGTYDGYSIMHPLNFDTSYLIDNCGKVINNWPSDFLNSTFAEITTNGTLIRSSVDPNTTSFQAGGGAGILQELAWDGSVIWNHVISDANMRLHHDVEILPSGNLLVIAWELKNQAECYAAGRNPGTLVEDEMWPTVIYELEQVYPTGANIVWEWHAWDHLIQDSVPSSGNYGNVQANFRRIDIHKGNSSSAPDWVHMNAIHYNAELDHIILSAPMFNEIWMIDHSTSTAEAADSVGGNRGVGGDLLWRWGNPQSYNQGSSAEQKLFFQHDCQWVEAGVRFDEHISVFNNRDVINGQLRSSVKIIRVHFDTISNSYPMNNGVFLPDLADYTYELSDTTISPGLSGVQVLPNDNLLITAGPHGHVFEIDSSDNVLWQYKVPMSAAGVITAQGDPAGLTKKIFKMKRYTSDYIGFDGEDLSPGVQIELNPLPCTSIVGLEEIKNEEYHIYPNPATDYLELTELNPDFEVSVTDGLGRLLYTFKTNDSDLRIDCSEWKSGMYYLKHQANVLSVVVN
ncbi:MAG: hypothetical protein COA38_09625 [Fluviicola sp.]|nr:MAG: hypothetical protein COA38_09625 [Fluviicola sp.]